MLVKKAKMKEKCPPTLYNQDRFQEGMCKKLEGKASIMTQSMKVWMKREDNLLRGIKPPIYLH